jgi:hypothetical protein
MSGPAWAILRPLFEQVNDILLGVSPTAAAKLTTIYIKYCPTERDEQPFAVLWVKRSDHMILGLALPTPPPELNEPSDAKLKYAGLTSYLNLTVGDDVPKQLPTWAQQAYDHVLKLPPALRSGS